MKKVLSLLLSAYMILSLSGCGNVQNTVKNNAPQTAIETQKSAKPTNSNAEKSQATPGSDLTVHYIDVGQGDSEFIELPNGETMLIDAGNSQNAADIISYIQNKGYSKIDYIVATHPHADHIGGMTDILGSFTIGKMYMPKKQHNTKAFEGLLDVIEQNSIGLYTAKAGTSILATDDLNISILSPISDSYSDLNDYSAVVKITYKGTSFLFMGDAESVVENELLQEKSDINADVLKVGHHGSSYSSTVDFIKSVAPKYAVISCGANNQYGHPHAETLVTLNSFNINTYRTDESGTIIITSDSVKITVDKKASAIKENAPPVVTHTEKPQTVTDNLNDDIIVYKTNYGKKYHNSGCQYLSKSKIPVSLQSAKSSGLTPCSKCSPPQ